MDLLVLGANGLLGSNVVASSLARRGSPTAAYHSEPPAIDVETVQFDIVDDDRFATLLDVQEPDAIVNCAAMTGVDDCEGEPERAREVNGRAPGRLAHRAADRSIEFVQVSTDYVFDGRSGSPYDEAAQTNPIQMYGESKLLGEQEVKSEHPAPLVVRLSFVWGRRGDDGRLEGFPAWVRNRLRHGESVDLFTDQYVTPTRAEVAAKAILDLLSHEVSGTHHVACRSCATPFEIGEGVADVLGESTDRLRAGSMDDLDRPATRPRYSCLDVSLVEGELDRRLPTLREDLVAAF